MNFEYHVTDLYAENVISNAFKLLTNVRYWVAHGQSETTVRVIDEAQHNGWEKLGWNELLSHRKRMKDEARDGC